MKILLQESSQSNHLSPEPPYLYTQGPLVKREIDRDANMLSNLKHKYGILLF